MPETKIHYNVPVKSVGISVVLSIIFGGLGLLYSDVKAGVIMSIIQFINFWLCFLVIGLFLIPVIHLICVAWGVSAVNKYNMEIMKSFK